MKKLVFSLSLLALAATTSANASSFIQLAPITDDSTIQCPNFTKLPDGTWKAVDNVPFSLGIIHLIIPPIRPIKVGGFIYNNVDLYSQLEFQCAGAVVIAKY